MKNEELMKRLANLGFPLLETGEDADASETLAEVVRSRDTRLLEGMPVLLANASEDPRFSPEKVLALLNDRSRKEAFRQLMLLSAALHEHLHLRPPWPARAADGGGRSAQREQDLARRMKTALAENGPLPLAGVTLDAGRVKRLFDLYYKQNIATTRQRQEKLGEFSLAFALSQVFSPKQKELFYKRLDGLPLTKTEMEYYSRSVKKKVVALANAELHALARKLLEQ